MVIVIARYYDADASESISRLQKSAYASIIAREAKSAGLPADIADAVVSVESGYNPALIGKVGEIGLMQVRPATAAMLGFKGSDQDLAKPETNIHYGVLYLAGAWRRADADLCRALMKYRAGHGEEVMTELSRTYCSRAIAHLTSVGSPYLTASLPEAVSRPRQLPLPVAPSGPIPKLNTRLRGAAFWVQQEARVRMITARVERRWRRRAAQIASR